MVWNSLHMLILRGLGKHFYVMTISEVVDNLFGKHNVITESGLRDQLIDGAENEWTGLYP